MSHWKHAAARALPGVVPCYIEPTQSDRLTEFRVDRADMHGRYGCFGALLVVLGIFGAAMAISQASRLGLLGAIQTRPKMMLAGLLSPVMFYGALGFLQQLDAVELIGIDDDTATHTRRRWWRWKEIRFGKNELRMTVHPASLHGGGWRGYVAVLTRHNAPMLIVAADKDGGGVDAFAERVSAGANIECTMSDMPLTVYGDAKLRFGGRRSA